LRRHRRRARCCFAELSAIDQTLAARHKHLASTEHCVDDEIIEWLKRREQRRRDKTASAANSNPAWESTSQ
jgi:hypothetical protein